MTNRVPLKPGDFSLGQTHEFIGAFGRSGGTPELLQAVIEDQEMMGHLIRFWRNGAYFPVITGTATEAEAHAIEILGDRRVITAAQANAAWNQPPSTNFQIRYSDEVLREAAESNARGETDFRLAYINAISLREMQLIVGTSTKRQPCFYKGSTWWLEDREDKWAMERPEAGYYLVDFKGRFARISWHSQEKEIARLGDSYERAHEAVVAEAIISIFQIHQERLLENWWHWGRSLDSDGDRVCVGRFGHSGFYVDDDHPDYGRGDVLQVCVARKFQN